MMVNKLLLLLALISSLGCESNKVTDLSKFEPYKDYIGKECILIKDVALWKIKDIPYLTMTVAGSNEYNDLEKDGHVISKKIDKGSKIKIEKAFNEVQRSIYTVNLNYVCGTFKGNNESLIFRFYLSNDNKFPWSKP